MEAAMKSPADSADLVRFHRAILEIDLRNSDDPHFLRHHGHDHLKEQLHAELVTGWIWRLTEAPSELLLLAARAHHLRRWAIPREDYPTGRAGYHQWRLALKDLHAAEAAAILMREGYPAELVARVQEIIRRKQLKTDAEQQMLEDAVCLTFLETQFGPTAARLPDKKMEDVLRKTLAKMSGPAVELARHLHYAHELRELLDRAAAVQ
ncbi:MAG: DUF4202 domain-containing protein [Acidobacteria bacterium]|nr:DUF4202 domain-containing protein [Acidobacteriota bacterium]